MAERSNKEIRKALKLYGKSKGYGSLWRQRTYDWLKEMRDKDPNNEGYVNSMNQLFGEQSSSETTSPLSVSLSPWNASDAYDRIHNDNLSLSKSWSDTHPVVNTEISEQPVLETSVEAPKDYSYGGTGNSFWNTSALTFISNLNKTDAGRGALQGYDTNGDNIISEDELRAMQGGKNLTADAKVGSRTLGAFKDLMNEEDYNASLSSYNNWVNSRRALNTAPANNTVNDNGLTPDQQHYNNMTAGVSTEGANLQRYTTGTLAAATTPSDMSDYSNDPKAPNNNVNGTYVKKTNQEYQQNPNRQQPGIFTKNGNAEGLIYKAVGSKAAQAIAEPILNRYAQWTSRLASARNILRRTRPFNMPEE